MEGLASREGLATRNKLIYRLRKISSKFAWNIPFDAFLVDMQNIRFPSLIILHWFSFQIMQQWASTLSLKRTLDYQSTETISGITSDILVVNRTINICPLSDLADFRRVTKFTFPGVSHSLLFCIDVCNRISSVAFHF